MAETDNLPDIRYSIRIFPLEEGLAVRLETEFSTLAIARRFLPRQNGWNLVLEIGEDADVQPVIRALRREGLEASFDLFISLVPASDSIIREVPRSVIQVIREFGCPMLVSYTSGTWATEE